MEVEEHLLGEIGDRLRIAARLISISCVRIERRHDAAAEEIVGRGECPLHLVIDDAAVPERRICIVQLVVPALLHEHLRIRAHRGIEYGVEIDIHEVLKIARIAACNRIHRLVRKCHRVEERVERSLHEFNERLLQRVLARAAEHGMLHDMRHPRIIHGRRAEADRKDLVVIRRFEKKETCARLFVNKCIRRPLRFLDLLRTNEAETVDDFIYFHVYFPPSYNGFHYSTARRFRKTDGNKKAPPAKAREASISFIPAETSSRGTSPVLRRHSARCREKSPPHTRDRIPRQVLCAAPTSKARCKTP